MRAQDLIHLAQLLCQHDMHDMLSQIVVQPRPEEAAQLCRDLQPSSVEFDMHRGGDWKGHSFTFYSVRVRV